MNKNGSVHHIVLPAIVIVLLAIVGIRIMSSTRAAGFFKNASLGVPVQKMNPAANITNNNSWNISTASIPTNSGILPPNNPSQNLPPNPNFLNYCGSPTSLTCYNSEVAAISNAHNVLESIPSLNLNVNAFSQLSPAKQIFVIFNLERLERGLPVIPAMTTQLNSVAQGGLNRAGDPSMNIVTTRLSGGGTIWEYGAVWGGGTINPLDADYQMMYYDGHQSNNNDCLPTGEHGCWGHRDIILGTHTPTSNYGTNCNSYMGAAQSPTGPYSIGQAAIIVGACGPTPTDETFTWAQAWNILNATPITSSPPIMGYWMVASDGGIFTFGTAPFHNSMGGQHLNAPIVGMAVTSDSNGYYEVANDGGIFSFNAPFHGSMGGQHLNAPIVGMAVDGSTGGYWEVGADGGVFNFQAPQYLTLGNQHLNSPIVGIAATPDGQGYYLVAADGGVFTGGDAVYKGSMGGQHLNAPIVGIALNRNGGYWEVGADGGIYSFGTPFHGSMGGQPLNAPIVGISATPDGGGYWMVAKDGGIFAFGDALFYGSQGGKPLNAPIVGIATSYLK